MKYFIDFLPEVESDIQNIYDWYEEQLEGLGEDFILSTDAVLNSVKRNPLVYEDIYKGIRKANTRRFPFGVFYIIEKDLITVLAVVHLSRHPKTWRQRRKRK